MKRGRGNASTKEDDIMEGNASIVYEKRDDWNLGWYLLGIAAILIIML